MLLRIRPPVRRKRASRKLNCSALKCLETRQNFDMATTAALAETNLPLPNVEESWNLLSQAIVRSAEHTIGFTKRRNQDWFDENVSGIRELLDTRNKALAAFLHDPSSDRLKRRWHDSRAHAQRALRTMQNEWWLHKAAELQGFADSGDLQNFYGALKQVYGPVNRSLVPVRSADGSRMLTSEDEILHRWHDYYRDLLNTHNACDPSLLDNIEYLPEVPELDD